MLFLDVIACKTAYKLQIKLVLFFKFLFFIHQKKKAILKY